MKSPRAPKNSTSAKAWQRFYERMAKFFDANNPGAEYPNAQKYAAMEAEKFRLGADLLKQGIHENQIKGRWK